MTGLTPKSDALSWLMCRSAVERFVDYLPYFFLGGACFASASFLCSRPWTHYSQHSLYSYPGIYCWMEVLVAIDVVIGIAIARSLWTGVVISAIASFCTFSIGFWDLQRSFAFWHPELNRSINVLVSAICAGSVPVFCVATTAGFCIRKRLSSMLIMFLIVTVGSILSSLVPYWLNYSLLHTKLIGYPGIELASTLVVGAGRSVQYSALTFVLLRGWADSVSLGSPVPDMEAATRQDGRILPILPVLLVAGASGGIIVGVCANLSMGDFLGSLFFIENYGLVFSGVGLAVGLSLTISQKMWIRLVCAAGFSVFGGLLRGVGMHLLGYGMNWRPGQLLMEWLELWAPSTILFVSVLHTFVSRPYARRSAWKSALHAIGFGAISGTAFWYGFDSGSGGYHPFGLMLPAGWFGGGVIGGLVFLGLVISISIQRVAAQPTGASRKG